MSTPKHYRNDEGQMIGLLENGVFYKEVKRSVHLLRIMNAWGIEERVVNDLRAKGCHTIHIFEREESNHYVISFKVFDLNGTRRDYSTPQVFLPVSWFGNQLALIDGKQKKRRTTKKDTVTAKA